MIDIIGIGDGIDTVVMHPSHGDARLETNVRRGGGGVRGSHDLRQLCCVRGGRMAGR